MNKYVEMKERHQKEVDEFPMKFAFTDKQFKESMEELGLNEKDTDKVISIGAGGFIRKTDLPKYKEMANRQYDEFKKAIEEDKTGEGFIKEMFLYELANHEYCITYEIEDTLASVGLTNEDIRNNKNLRVGLILAEKEYIANYNKENEEDEEDEEEYE